MRLDQWLWAVRVYKTRSVAADAIKGGLVKIAGESVKPAREARPGDVIAARVGHIVRTVKVVDAPRSRVGAKLVALYMEDLTPPEEYAKPREAFFAPILRPRGAGRPTKKERRQLDELGG
jgi:ribosome-associated heat shock protein Hsp15